MRNQMTVLYDGLCPVCMREIRFLRRFDRRDGLNAVDIAAPGFDPSRYGLSLAECVGSLRGIGPNGERLDGMDTIRAMYAAAGLGALMAWTRAPLVAPICDAAYRLFAGVRPRLSRFRPDACATDRCQKPD